ncbi:heme ABC exporter ATP-binding protein CcmA [Sesbania bispinosa]|nr:heme ABC exporter ATP-binding protein CcmA [Sesbania bispinosa]
MGVHGGVAAGKGSSVTEAQPREGGESRAWIGWCRLRGVAAALLPARKGTKPRDGGEGRGEWRLAVVNSGQRTPLPRLRGRWQIGTDGARTAARSAAAAEPLPSSPIFPFFYCY